MRSIISRGILAATAALLAACNSTDSVAPVAITPASATLAVSAAERGTDMWQSVDRYVWLSCAEGGAGEAVRVTGDLRYAFQLTQDASGVSHLSIKSNTSGLTGVGLTSGTSIRGMMAEHVNSRAEDELNMDVRTDDVIRFVAPGSGVDYSLVVSSRFVIDQGTYVLAEQTWKEVCR